MDEIGTILLFLILPVLSIILLLTIKCKLEDMNEDIQNINKKINNKKTNIHLSLLYKKYNIKPRCFKMKGDNNYCVSFFIDDKKEAHLLKNKLGKLLYNHYETTFCQPNINKNTRRSMGTLIEPIKP